MDIATDGCFIITGAAGGIAGSVISTFAEAKARLALVDINGVALADRAQRYDALAIETDLTDPAAVGEMVGDVREAFGRIDGLIHTTGGFAMAEAESTDEDLYDTLFDLNVRSLVITAAAVLPVMLDQGRGFIAGFSAAPGWYGSGGAGMTVYAAAKSAVAAYLRAVGEETADRGVTTAVVYPMGVVDTEGNRASMPDADRSAWIDPAQIARALLFAATSGPRGRLTELPIFPAATSGQ